MPDYLHVVVAVIQDPSNHKVLIAKRPDDKHQGGKWEFPGGKVEPNETAQHALIREINEELGCHIQQAKPLIQIYHHYSDLSVCLDVYTVTQYSGDINGKEGQQVRWVHSSKLTQYDFPAANRTIIQAINLPKRCLITAEPTSHTEFLTHLEHALKQGIKLVQFRVKTLDATQYSQLAKASITLCHQFSTRIILNSPPQWINDADGLHLTSQQLQSFTPIKAIKNKLLSASCHNANELTLAARLSTDFVFLSPVQKTQSHPNATPLGWQQFNELSKLINCPIYALGGLQENNLAIAQQNGAQGIAAISHWWTLPSKRPLSI